MDTNINKSILIVLCMLSFETVIGDDASSLPNLLNSTVGRHMHRNANIPFGNGNARKLKKLDQINRPTNRHKSDEPKPNYEVVQDPARTGTPTERAVEHSERVPSTYIGVLLYWTRLFLSWVAQLFFIRTEGTQSTRSELGQNTDSAPSFSGGNQGHEGSTVHDRARILAEGVPPIYRYVCGYVHILVHIYIQYIYIYACRTLPCKSSRFEHGK
jgi:hypothetical protein